jgi:predicted transglutaminase-like cysteine proteinase
MRSFSFHFRTYFFVALACAAPGISHAGNSYFDMKEERNSNMKPFPKWTGMIDRYDGQKKIPDEQCGTIAYHPCKIREWKQLTEEIRADSLDEKLEKVNDWGNEHPYIVDQINWGMGDYWETPHEFMEVNGDCEDYAIAKYYSLALAGVPEDQMRIIIVQDLNLGGIIHAVLGVYEGEKLWILDNQIKQVKDASSIYHYRPIYGTNTEYWWRYYPRQQL